MKKTKPYYLKYYKEWMETGLIPHRGLCNCLEEKDDNFSLFSHGKNGYWGYDGKSFPADCVGGMYMAIITRGITEYQARHEFTPFRQTIVLFLAAMNSEL